MEPLKSLDVCVGVPGDMISPGVQSTNMGRNESTPDLRDARYAEVAAIQNSLAHMTMPHHSDLAAYGHSTPPPNRGQRSPLLSPSGMQPGPPHTLSRTHAICLKLCAKWIRHGSRAHLPPVTHALVLKVRQQH